MTLAVLLGAMVLFGGPGARRASSPDPQAAVVPGTDPVVQPVALPEPVVVAAEAQTPQRVQSYPGPPLKPSPEFAGRATPVAEIVPVDGVTMMYVTASSVNLRAGPSTSDSVIGALNGGSPVEVLGPEDAGWVNIRDAQGRIGYISGQFLSSDAPG